MQVLKTLLSLIVVLIILALGIGFSLRNQQLVELDLLFVQLAPNSMALWLILSLVTGLILGCLLMLPWVASYKARLLSQTRQLKQQHKELHQLRTLSFKAPE